MLQLDSSSPTLSIMNESQLTIGDNTTYTQLEDGFADVVGPVVFAPVTILGFVLNIGTIATILNSQSLSNRGVHVFLVNKAIADLVTSLTYPIVYAAFPYGKGAELYLFILSAIGSLGIYTSLLWNAAISIERFVMIYFPLKALTYTKRIKIILTSTVWAIGVFGSIILTLFTLARCNDDSMRNVKYQNKCALFTFDRSTAEIMVSTVFPAATILIMYILVVRKLCDKSTELRMSVGKNKQRRIAVKQKQITVMLLVDAVVTAVTWIPWRLIFTVGNICGVEDDNVKLRGRSGSCVLTLETITIFIWMTNCFITPVIYFTLNSSFRVSQAFEARSQAKALLGLCLFDCGKYQYQHLMIAQEIPPSRCKM